MTREEDLSKAVTPLMSSSFEGHDAAVAKCRLCDECSAEWGFHVRDGILIVQVCGEHNDAPRTNEWVKVVHAMKYRHLTYELAKAELRAAGVHEDEWPEKWRHQNQRRTLAKSVREHFHIEAVCLGALRDFLQSPLPDVVHIFHEQVVCTPDKIRVPFACQTALNYAREQGLTSFLMDFTFKTNQQGLLLGAIGPVGIQWHGCSWSSKGVISTLTLSWTWRVSMASRRCWRAGFACIVVSNTRRRTSRPLP